MSSHKIQSISCIRHFGLGVGYLKGKNTISNTFTVHDRVVSILDQIIERYKNVIESADIMQVNKITFII